MALGTVACLLAVAGGCSPSQQTPAASARQRTVSVAAAADLKFALDDLATWFRAAHPDIGVRVTYGSSGNFFTQLSSHAPFDIFFSADIEYPRKLIDQGLGLKETEFRYAVGRIVVWVPKSSPLDIDKLGIEALAGPSVRKVAIANPKHAPYGRAAEAAMKKLGVYDRVKDRLVFGENIAQTAQFVETGAADIGVVALSLAMAPRMRDKGRYWNVPLDAYPPMEQGGVILAWANDREATGQFRSFVLGEQGREILRQYGFFLPEK
jgi:molybdate transport system substrate-binding protein